MSVDDVLRKVIADALTKNQVAKRDDLLENYPLEITVSPEYQGYTNPRVTLAIDSMSNGEVTHLTFIPLVTEGIVVIQPATDTVVGAIDFVRGDSRRTGIVNLRVALNKFKLTFNDRKLKFPVLTLPMEIQGEERNVVLIRVKRPRSNKTLTRTSKTPRTGKTSPPDKTNPPDKISPPDEKAQ